MEKSTSQEHPFQKPFGASQGRFLLHDSDQFASSTDSTCLKGFVFIGRTAFDLDTTKGKPCVSVAAHGHVANLYGPQATVPKYVPRKSRRELRRFTRDGEMPRNLVIAKCLVRVLAETDCIHLDNEERPPKKAKLAIPKTVRSRGPEYQGTSKPPRDEPSSETSSESESDDDSDYESGSEEELEIEELSPLPAARPTEPSKAVEYDTIKAVWAPRTSPPTPAAIRTALGDYWNVVKAIRDAWKADTAALQQAEEAKQLDKVSFLKNKVIGQRKIMELILDTTIKYGHKDIIERYVQSFPNLFRPPQNQPPISVICSG